MSSFEDKYSKLNKGQKEAVDAIEGPVMVIAGPGTGKTTILTLRIANILKKTDVPPDAILALTFTESGVRAMRKKLSEIIGSTAYRVKIHTFHSFANDIIKIYPDKFPRIIGSEHVEGLEQIALVEKILENGYEKGHKKFEFDTLRPKGDPVYYVSKIISAIRELKRENISPDDFEKLINKEEKEILNLPDLKHEKGKYAGKIKGEYQEKLKDVAKNRELLSAYREYEKALEKARLYDFEDMIIEVVKELERNEDLRLRIQEEHQYILADEHQDANTAQNKLLELVSSFHDDPNLFIVGDEKQAIFRFQGASLENFLYFKRRFPKALLVRLSENYRSHQTILDASHSLILNNQTIDDNLRVKLSASSGSKPQKISCFSFPDNESELNFIASEADRLIKSGVPAREVAILIRNNNQAESIERSLVNLSLPVARFADADILDNVYSEAFFSVVRASLYPTNDELVSRAMFAPFLNLDAIVISKALDNWKKNKGILIESLSENKDLKIFSNLVSNFSRIVNSEPLVDSFETIARDSGLIEFFLSHKKSRELIPLYSALLNTVVRFAERERSATMRTFIERLDHARDHGYSIASAHIPPDGVSLMTAHGSKGLEFEYVFIVHSSDNVWGDKSSRKAFHLPVEELSIDGNGAEDERRLFYVALTRAKKHVYITYSESDNEGRELSPSRFISEITDAHIEYKNKISSVKINHNQKTENISIFKDRSYIKTLFLERGFSVTHLNNYLECPWRYFFVNLLMLPKSQENPALYGSAIHAALCYFFESYKREEAVSIEATINLFENHLHRTHMTERDLKEYIKSGKEALKTYLSGHKFSKNIWNEYKITGVPLKIGKDEIRLTGNLDKIELVGDGRVNVVDYKTGKPKSRNFLEGKTKDADGNYKRQLVFYKLLLDKYKKGEWKMETGTIDFVQPSESGKLQREIFSISDKEVSELETLIEKTAGEIINFSFEEKECKDKNCEWCKLHKTAISF